MSGPDRKAQPVNEDAAKEKPATSEEAEKSADAVPPNPPRTTVGGWFTAPKFGSAGGGGGEIEPGPERD